MLAPLPNPPAAAAAAVPPLPNPPPLAAAAPPLPNDVPEEYLCGITFEIMEDPVICADGHTYERAAIARWLQNHNTSPNTNAVLEHRNLVPNIALRQIIQRYHQQQG